MFDLIQQASLDLNRTFSKVTAAELGSQTEAQTVELRHRAKYLSLRTNIFNLCHNLLVLNWTELEPQTIRSHNLWVCFFNSQKFLRKEMRWQ